MPSEPCWRSFLTVRLFGRVLCVWCYGCCSCLLCLPVVPVCLPPLASRLGPDSSNLKFECHADVAPATRNSQATPMWHRQPEIRMPRRCSTGNPKFAGHADVAPATRNSQATPMWHRLREIAFTVASAAILPRRPHQTPSCATYGISPWPPNVGLGYRLSL